jgi:hypothetical protein
MTKKMTSASRPAARQPLRHSLRLASDIGGTFTDIVLRRGEQSATAKLLTTPAAPEQAMIEGILQVLAEVGAEPRELDLLVHGTTLATNALIDAGCDVVTCHVDGPKVVIETAEKRGVKSCGHNASQAPLAPKGFLTGAEYKWETIYKIYADLVAKGQPLPNMLAGGYDTDMVMNTAFGAGAGEEARKAATSAIADLKAKKPIYVGPLKDNKGKLVIDKAYDNYDPYLDQMDYLLEGVIGSIT